MENKFSDEWLRALAAALAACDGKSWYLADEPLDLPTAPGLRWRAYFRVEGSDESIYIAEGKGSYKANISGIFPTSDVDGLLPRPDYIDIGVSRSRPVADIATDIARRLLPGYRDALARHNENIARQVARSDATRAAAARLGIEAARTARTARTEIEGRIEFNSDAPWPQRSSCIVTVSPGLDDAPRVALEFRGLTTGQAEALLSIARAMLPEEATSA